MSPRKGDPTLPSHVDPSGALDVRTVNYLRGRAYLYPAAERVVVELSHGYKYAEAAARLALGGDVHLSGWNRLFPGTATFASVGV